MTDLATAELIQIKRRRLQVLTEQQAGFGHLFVPPHISMEIEQIQGELRRLQAHPNLVRAIRLETERPPRMPGLLALASPERFDMPYDRQAAFEAIDYTPHG